MRSLLIEDGDKLILIDNGIGDKQDDKFLRHYYLHGDVNLKSSLLKHGFSADDITDVFLSHLHFDHCGGSVIWNKDRSGFEMAFKNANIGQIKIIGNGLQNQTQRKSSPFKRKYTSNSGDGSS